MPRRVGRTDSSTAPTTAAPALVAAAFDDWPANDLRVLGYALGSQAYTPYWDRYRSWVDAVGDMGVVYLPAGYSAVGHLLHYWLGVQGTVYAAADWPVTVNAVSGYSGGGKSMIAEEIAR